jgi:hypothetical protein
MKARFTVFERLDAASVPQRGTLSIDRETGLCEVRPLRRRRVYALPVSFVARMVCRHVLLQELAERRAARARGRR